MLVSVSVMVTAASALFAQGQPATKAPAAGNAAVRQEILNIYNSAANKALALAKAIPQDKMSWRPMEGVRSFGEVFVHIAGSTLLFCSHAGMKMPEGPLHDLASVYMKRGFELPEIFASEAAIKEHATGALRVELFANWSPAHLWMSRLYGVSLARPP